MKGIIGFVVFLLVGCVPTPPAGNFPSLSSDAITDQDIGSGNSDGGTAVSGPIHPDGTWLFWTETVSCINALNTRINGLSWGLNLAYPVELSNNTVSWVVHGCHYSQSTLFGVETVIPDRFAESSPDRIYSIKFTPKTANRNKYAPGASFAAATSVELWGVKLSDPINDPLPTSADDPRVWDMDGDGHPGGTIWTRAPNGKKICDIWIVHRAISKWHGTVKSAILMEGGGPDDSEENFIYSSGAICSAKSKVDFLDDKNRAIFLRIDGKYGAPNLDKNHDGHISCDELRAADLSAWIKPAVPNDDVCKKGD